MSNCLRALTPGGTWFFTVKVLGHHVNDLLFRNIDVLRACAATERARRRLRFARVVFPEPKHWIRTLPAGDADFPTRMRRSREASESAICRTHAPRNLNAWGGELSRSPGEPLSITD